jgi:hypothetical protein
MKPLKDKFIIVQEDTELETTTLGGDGNRVIDVLFVNKGTAPVTINKFLELSTGESFRSESIYPYFNCSIYDIAFRAGTKKLIVVAKVLNSKNF